MLSGYLLNTGIIPVPVVFITLISYVSSDVQIPPRNTVGYLNTETFLNCSISGGLQEWMDSYSSDISITISIDTTVDDAYKNDYGIEGVSQNYNLIVLSAKYEQAGTHTCRTFGSPSQSNAEIIVLDSDPVCITNTTSTGNILIEGEYAYYKCHVNYNGAWGPKMVWTSNGDTINPENESDLSPTPKLIQYSYTVSVTVEHDQYSVQVVTSFDGPPSPGTDDATNAPEYTPHTENFPAITVHYSPRDVKFHYCTDLDCVPIDDSDTQININPGDRIHASAAANPNVDYYTWMNGTDIISEGMDKNELTFNYTGSSSIECIVRNTMRGDTQATKSRMIEVFVVPTTTPPSTTTPIPTIPSSPETSTGTGGPPATDESTEKDELGAGAIAGIVIGVLAAIVICVIIIICVCRKSDKEKKANETMPPKKVHADQVRQPENNGPTTITNIDEKPPYDYNQYPENPYDNNVNPYAQDGRPNENLVYADLALDDTPRSRKPVQVFEPVQYAEIRRV